MSQLSCFVDVRVDNRINENLSTLMLGEHMVCEYPILEALRSQLFDKIRVITNSNLIKYKLKDTEGITFEDEISSVRNAVIISGRAPFIMHNTIKKMVSESNGGGYSVVRKFETNFGLANPSFLGDEIFSRVNAMAVFDENGDVINREFVLDDKEGIVINTVNDFELALSIFRKGEMRKNVLKNVLNEIKSKEALLSLPKEWNSVTLIGHSQIDQWKVETLFGKKVYNVGISGMSSFEFNDYVLAENKLVLGSEYYIVMHGTNDIVWGYTLDEIADSILKTIEYVRVNNCHIIFLECIHVNGRLDRNNTVIDNLNMKIKEMLPKEVRVLSMKFLDDKFGNLDAKYTIDGLHLNGEAYKKIESELQGLI